MMIVFSVFFGNLAKVSSDGLPYPIFAYCGLLPWQLFAYALTNAANSLVANERLVTKVYFSRVTLPISSVLAGLVDFAIAFALLLVLMAYYGCAPSDGIVALLFTGGIPAVHPGAQPQAGGRDPGGLEQAASPP